jgi:hypothetical protein
VQNTSNPQTFRDLYEQWGIFDINDVSFWCLGYVQRKPEDLQVWLPKVHVTGGNEEIHERV